MLFFETNKVFPANNVNTHTSKGYMKNWFNLLSKYYQRIVNSIAFYPTIIALAFMVFSIFVMRIEFNDLVIELKSNIERVLVHDSNNARLILGTIVGSLISLMVFSFSMVMIVLNRATSTLSPRVIPGLISDKFHQIVLGFYLGSIIYSLILIVNIDAPGVEFSVPSLGIFISMILAIVCMGFFVYFIHSISQKIQVDYILNDIYKLTKKELEGANHENAKKELPDTSEWITCYAKESGYLKKIDGQGLTEFCKRHEIKLQVKISIGSFVVKGYPFIVISKKLDDDVTAKLDSYFTLYTEERVSDHYLFGFKQISEIAVKALSPGINDPGTAVKAIDLLSDLLTKLMKVDEQNYVPNSEEEPLVFVRPVPFKDVMFQIIVPIREYGKKDVSVLVRLLDCIKHMIYSDIHRKRFTHLLISYVENFLTCSKEYIDNKLDRENINDRLKEINTCLEKEKQFQLL